MRGRESPDFWGTVHLPGPYRVQTVVKTYNLQSRENLLPSYKLTVIYFPFRGFIPKHQCCFFGGSRRYHSWIAAVHVARQSQTVCTQGCAQTMQLPRSGSGRTRSAKTGLRRGQRKVDHKSPWDILALHLKWAVGLGLERFGFNLFPQMHYFPLPSGRRLLCFSHASTPVGLQPAQATSWVGAWLGVGKVKPWI